MKYLGIFAISFAIFFFEVACAQFLGFTVGPGFELLVIGIAMMGLCSAGSLLACVAPKWKTPEWLIPSLCLFMGAGFLAVLFGNSWVKGIVNQAVDAGIAPSAWLLPRLAAFMLIPYFLFGLILTLIFRQCPSAQFGRVYFFDLFGGAMGCLGAYFAFEYGDFRILTVIPLLLAILGAGLMTEKVRQFYLCLPISLIVCFITLGLSAHWEPRPNLDLLSRNLEKRNQVKELWHGWNSYSRVGLIEVTRPDGTQAHKLQLGNGDGEAILEPYPARSHGRGLVSSLSTALKADGKILVLMSGAGADMVGIDSESKGKAEIFGVELNSRVKEGALFLEAAGMKNFYAKSNIHYLIDEARSFLDRTDERFDTILVSFSGATYAYYSGAIGHTSQYVYTVEAMKQMLSRLRPEGMLILVNTNKVRLLENYKQAINRRPSNEVIVLGKGAINWGGIWDDNVLLLKPSGFTNEEVDKIEQAASPAGRKLLYAPHRREVAGFEIYPRQLTSENETLASVPYGRRRLDLSAVTDDKPFILNLEPKAERFQWATIERILDEGPRGMEEMRFLYAILFALVGVFLIGFPLLWKGGIPLTARNAQHLAYFATIGAAFMLVEIGFLQKMSLLLGPGLTLPVVLGGMVFFAGLGSLASETLVGKSHALLMALALLAIPSAAFLLYGDSFLALALKWSMLLRTLAVLLVISPIAFAQGFFMPIGLSAATRDDVRLSGWCWGINGITGTIAACLSPVLAVQLGFSTLILIGLLSYGALGLLPRYYELRIFFRRHSHPATANI